MIDQVNNKAFRQFAKNLFLMSKVHIDRKKAEEALDAHHSKMRSSIIGMRLSYTDMDSMKEKVGNLIDSERKYARTFKPNDSEIQQLKSRVMYLERELAKEREEKQKITDGTRERIRQLSESFDNIKSQMMHLHLEKAKRQQRLRALEEKINKNIDVHEYFHS